MDKVDSGRRSFLKVACATFVGLTCAPDFAGAGQPAHSETTNPSGKSPVEQPFPCNSENTGEISVDDSAIKNNRNNRKVALVSFLGVAAAVGGTMEVLCRLSERKAKISAENRAFSSNQAEPKL